MATTLGICTWAGPHRKIRRLDGVAQSIAERALAPPLTSMFSSDGSFQPVSAFSGHHQAGGAADLDRWTRYEEHGLSYDRGVR